MAKDKESKTNGNGSEKKEASKPKQKEASSAELIAFLEQEKARSEKEAKITWSVGGALALVIIVYFSWLYATVKSEILNPEALSDVAAFTAEESIPQYMKDAEDQIMAYAPEFARTLSDQVKDLGPSLRKKIQREIKKTYGLIPELDKTLQQIVRTYIQENQEDIKEFFKSHDAKDFANYMAEVLIQDIQYALLSENNIEEMKSDSLELMKNLEDQITSLASKNPNRLSRMERQQLRLIASLYRYLSEQELM